ncbi:SagB/ThcOx family dehydrogenase [Pimelobacter simplex]|uniref:SagB/ThcOx family dehydrogenase n=3 Tax=Nocardioides simplex TaxID=2045 RepID=UPI0008E0B550|nr:SagB/ThcOx family dehydrogenase [Pimelobacter simplex]GEB15951.1 hypothetical protein NSI01_42660 [Pimelobacter simplex]SFM82971.1 SagB-type dehydrogenase domain-containing protein [Pimelobacter simplex]
MRNPQMSGASVQLAPNHVLAMTADPSGRFRVRRTTERWDALLSNEQAALAALAVKPSTIGDLVHEAERELGLPASVTTPLVMELLKAGILISRADDVVRFGWRHASRYHSITFDYPFHYYGTPSGGYREDVRRMNAKAAVEPDDDREKLTVGPITRLPAPRQAAALLQERPLTENFGDRLSAALSLAFGAVGWAQPAWTGAPTMRRTSPSGGARHPSECYLLARSVDGLSPGWHHLHPRTPALCQLNSTADDEEQLAVDYPGSFGRADFEVAALVVITTVFRRNMYRYREPRTFRTVHMDVGHLAATFMALCSVARIETCAHDATSPAATESALGLDWLDEGAQYVIAVGERGDR